jgi:hypothetical protein
MTSKKKPLTPSPANLQTLRIGSQVHCSDDGVTGRIVWANAVSVKIRWEDVEQVTCRRDSLAGRDLEILDADTASAESLPAELPVATAAQEHSVPEQNRAAESPLSEPCTNPMTAEQATALEAQTAASVPTLKPAETSSPAVGSSSEPSPIASAKPKRQRKASGEERAEKLSALDAAAKVLQEAGTAMSCQELIQAMAAKGYWTSPAGKTPQATLYSALLREITTKGATSRFQKIERGKFAHRAGA